MDGRKVALGSLILLMTALVGVCNALNFGADAEADLVAPNGDIDPDVTSVFYSDDAVGIADDAGGYSATSILAPTDIVFDNTDQTMYATAPFSMRSGPGVFFLSVSKFYYGQEVHITGTSDSGWYKIEYNDQEVYAYHSCLSETEPAAKFFTDEYGVVYDVIDEDAYITIPHYIMTGPGITYENIGTVQPGQRVRLIGRSAGGWNIIEVDGVRAYAYGECVSADTNDIRITINDIGTTMVDVTGYAHAPFVIRREPSASSERVGAVCYGDEIHVTGICDNGYYEVEENGRTGYILGAAVQFTEPRRRDVEDDRESLFDEEEEEDIITDTEDTPEDVTVVTGTTDGDVTETTPANTPVPTPEGGSEAVIIVNVDGETGESDTVIITDAGTGTTETEPTAAVTTAPLPTDTPTPTPSPSPIPTPTPEPAANTAPDGYQNPSEAQRLLQMVNDYRAQNGLGPLSWSGELESAAQVRASEISIPNCFSHIRPDGSEYWTANGNLIYGENIAAGQATAEDVFNSWINSDAHRNNILGNYTIMGVALYVTSNAAYTYYWAQEFG